jgi:hypothetical protein
VHSLNRSYIIDPISTSLTPPSGRTTLPASHHNWRPSGIAHQDSLPWHEFAQLRLVEFQPAPLATFLMPLLCVVATTLLVL